MKTMRNTVLTALAIVFTVNGLSWQMNQDSYQIRTGSWIQGECSADVSSALLASVVH